MIALGAESEDPQLIQSPANVSFLVSGNEMPLSSCDFGDLSLPLESDVMEDLLLQNFNDVLLMDSQMHLGESVTTGSHETCSLTAALLGDTTQRPRDLNLSSIVEIPSVLSLDSSVDLPSQPQIGSVTPTHAGGSTPENVSRAASPAWSESSGGYSSSTFATPTGNGTNIPRHKRPSHKRAEIKRRSKIKTCLDDLKESVPSIRDKGRLSESAILSKAAEYIHHLKDGCAERGSKTANLRREIQCLSEEIHSFQESLPATGLKEEAVSKPSLDELYQEWLVDPSHKSTKFSIFASITSKLFESFKEVIGPVTTRESLNAQTSEWQATHLSLPVLRKEILKGMLALSRKASLTFPEVAMKVDPHADEEL